MRQRNSTRGTRGDGADNERVCVHRQQLRPQKSGRQVSGVTEVEFTSAPAAFGVSGVRDNCYSPTGSLCR